MMKVLHFSDPTDYTFARAGRRGTWFPDPGPGACPECGAPRQARVPPLILEWLPDSNRIGDFTWPGLDDELVVSGRVRRAFEEHFRGFDFYPIIMWQDPKLHHPQRVTKRTKPRVWLPYEGPALWDLQVTVGCHLNLEQSGLRLEKACITCGDEIYSWPPFEERRLVVDPNTWDGSDIFRVHEYPRWIFCTERVRALVQEMGFTNAGFLEDGVIPA